MKNEITFQNFEECLFTENVQMKKMNVIRSRKHEIFSETVNKNALSTDDNKRIIMVDKISTLVPSHYKNNNFLKNAKSNFQSDRNS